MPLLTREDVLVRLAMVENVVRIAMLRGATEREVRESVEYAIRTPVREDG